MTELGLRKFLSPDKDSYGHLLGKALPEKQKTYFIEIGKEYRSKPVAFYDRISMSKRRLKNQGCPLSLIILLSVCGAIFK